jgi:hypothetical protein
VFYDALKQLWEASFKGLIIEATVGHLNPQFITMIQLHRRKIKFFFEASTKGRFSILKLIESLPKDGCIWF